MKLTDHIRLLFQKEKEPFLRLQKILGFLPHNIEFYRLALMHKSIHVTQDARGHHVNNERLEFLSDAILSAVVADILYFRYPNKQEGFLTTLRSKLVCRDMLNKLAVQIGLDKLVLHDGRGSSAHNSYMNGNAFEAFFGAIYLDRGYSYCMRFMRDVVLQKYINLEEVSQKDENYKSKLIEWCQKYQYKFEFTPKESRDENNIPIFHSSALVEGIPCGTGDGYSKKESDQNAAKQALKRIKHDKELLAGIQNAKERRGMGANEK